jgi:hypothetical protein
MSKFPAIQSKFDFGLSLRCFLPSFFRSTSTTWNTRQALSIQPGTDLRLMELGRSVA